MSSKQEPQDVEMEEDNNDNEDSNEEPAPAARFTDSGLFSFMTTDAYKRLEEVPDVNSGKIFKHVRPMRAKMGLLDNPHGSVRLFQGTTSVLAAVYGPSDIRMSKELPHRAAVDVLYRPKVTGSANVNSMIALGMMDPIIAERGLEQTLTSILESVIHLEDHVLSGFNVIVHELENNGCLLSTCINAVSLALLNAGCSLRSMFAAVTLYVSGDTVLVDPSSSQIEQLMKSSDDSPVSNLTITCTNDKLHSPQVLHVHGTGRVSPKVLRSCYDYVCSDAIMPEIFGFFAGVVASDLGRLGLVSNSGSAAVINDNDDDDEDEGGMSS